MTHQSILIIEDNVDLARAMTALLRKAGFQTTYVLDAQRAFESLGRGLPTLVILDISLPTRNGLDVLEEIRCHAEWSDLPVMIYTAIDEPSVRDRAHKLGVLDYVIKGALDGPSISALVDRHLRNRVIEIDRVSPAGGTAVKTLQ